METTTTQVMQRRSSGHAPRSPWPGAVATLGPTLALAAILAACGGQKNAGNATAGTGTATGAAAGTTAAATQSATAGTTATANAAAPGGQGETVVNAIGTHGEDLYDAVSASQWSKAQTIVDSLGTASQSLGSAGVTGQDAQQLTPTVDSLRRLITSHQRAGAMEAANHVTYLAAQMSKTFHPATPAEVALLDYYGRELTIWSAAKNTAKLTQTSRDIQSTWTAVRPQVVAHGGTAQATRTDALVKEIAAARTPAMYARAATPLLDEVDALEKVFSTH